MAVYNPFDFFLEDWAENFPFRYDDTLARELAPYLVKLEATPLFAKFVESVDAAQAAPKERTIDFLVRINQRLQQDIRYLIRMEPGVQTPEETLASAAGSCRDSGWLLVQALRHLGLAARFVSGYLIQLRPDVKSLDGPSGLRDRLHRPARVVRGLPAGRGLDRPRPDVGPARRRRPHPARGHAGAGQRGADLGHRQHEQRRVPPRDEGHADVRVAARDAAVHAVAMERDRRARAARSTRALDAMDVRLTQGGEPTFVAIENRDAGEWNTDALGPTKRGYALRLLPKLTARYGPNGFMHFGQGKWYPGEPLPRWALSALWRIDGEPCVADAVDLRRGPRRSRAGGERERRARPRRAGPSTMPRG